MKRLNNERTSPRFISDLRSSVFICGSPTPGFLLVESLPAYRTECQNRIALPPQWRFLPLPTFLMHTPFPPLFVSDVPSRFHFLPQP